jgi:hypothetical protein
MQTQITCNMHLLVLHNYGVRFYLDYLLWVGCLFRIKVSTEYARLNTEFLHDTAYGKCPKSNHTKIRELDNYVICAI